MFINFSEIAGHNNIFLDYLYEFENVEKYYKIDFRKTQNYNNVFDNLVNQKRPHRKLVAHIISNQYEELKPSKQTQLNIRALEEKNTVAITTGQQLGIMGGPLYTLYKIITAIKLASSLKNQYDGYNFVPVFWLEADDHDFDEVTSFNFIDKNNQLSNLKYDDGLEEDINRGGVGSIPFNRNINEVFKLLNETLRGTEFTDELLDLMYSYYKENATFKSAFKKLIFRLFDEYGLVIFDPQDRNVKKLLTPVFKNEIINFREHANLAVERSAELEDLYHAQVKVKPINMFISDETGRYLLEPVDDHFRLKGKKTKYSLDDILELLDSNPGNFSPNVLLRPICQDYLLPTGMYIGGPGEISYFAQVIPLYDMFNVVQPILYPRSSATIVEKSVLKVMEKFDLKYQDFFYGGISIKDKIIRSLEEIEVKKEFNNTRNEIELTIDKLKEKLFAVDPTLKELANKSSLKIEQILNQLEQKTEKAQERQYETTLNQIGKAVDFIMPNSNLQEREINFIYFANKYGLDFIKLLMNELTINKFEHQVIEL
ncbi:MAG: bacillithiol biosynthesis cysteine-adding enzyme BshC [Melioribacteraceae bacterium]|nr:bacillithiol biosynthesis cysteine-adding enzyme BshC [Melioribacteraceae bacterium]